MASYLTYMLCVYSCGANMQRENEKAKLIEQCAFRPALGLSESCPEEMACSAGGVVGYLGATDKSMGRVSYRS